MSVAVQAPMTIVPANPLPRRHPSAAVAVATVSRPVASIGESRPLPTPPTLVSRPSLSRRLGPAAAPIHRSSSRASATPQTRLPRESLISSTRTSGLVSICASPRILLRLLRFAPLSDLCALDGTSRAVRRVLREQDIKDAIFAHFIPGYAKALRIRDRHIWEDSVQVTYADLRQLRTSKSLFLSRDQTALSDLFNCSQSCRWRHRCIDIRCMHYQSYQATYPHGSRQR